MKYIFVTLISFLLLVTSNVAYSAETKVVSKVKPKIEKTYYPNGKVEFERRYLSGGLEGIKQFYENGHVKIEAAFKNGKADGITRLYYPSSKLEQVSNMKEGIDEGRQETYYESGELLSEVNFKNGKEEGEYKVYYKSSALESIRNFKNGLVEGLVKTFYKNGFPMGEHQCKNNLLQGLTKTYSEKGGLEKELIYKDGKLHGLVKFYKNGSLVQEANYQDDKLHGINIIYYPNGVVEQRAQYDNGKLINAKTYNQNGILSGEWTNINGQLKLVNNMPSSTTVQVQQKPDISYLDNIKKPIDLVKFIVQSPKYLNAPPGEKAKLNGVIGRLLLQQVAPGNSSRSSTYVEEDLPDYSSELDDIQEQLRDIKQLNDTIYLQHSLEKNH